MFPAKEYVSLLSDRPDMTYAVDWALKVNYLSIYPFYLFVGSLDHYGKMFSVAMQSLEDKLAKGQLVVGDRHFKHLV